MTLPRLAAGCALALAFLFALANAAGLGRTLVADPYNAVLQSDTRAFLGDELAEMVEIKEHPWFVACQFHPEFKSRPLEPHPLFASFVRAVVEARVRPAADDADQQAAS